MKIPRFLSGREVMFRRHIAFSLLSTAIAGIAWPVEAQNRAVVAPTAKSAPSPLTAVAAAPSVNILLLALDSLEAPPPSLPSLPPPPAQTGNGKAGAAITPAAITPAIITPASVFLAPDSVARWSAQAQKKSKDKNADLFTREPETGMLPLKNSLPRVPDANPGVPFLPAPSAFGAGALSSPEAPLPPGRAQLAAVPLRRALMALGWNDVLTASPDSAAISRALGERRLTPRALDSLKRAMSQLAQPGAAPSSQATQSALQAAARVGQTLGYRAVVAFYVATPSVQEGAQNAAFSLIVADSAREEGEPILFDEKGTDEASLREAGASTAAALLDKTLRAWPAASAPDRAALAQKHLEVARAALVAGDVAEAQEQLSQTVGLDSSRSEPYVMLGDLLATSDPVGAATAYRRAVELNARDGMTWTKIAVALSSGVIPDWPRSLEAGRQALASNFDSVELRVAMATAQFGRADLFRRADRRDRAEDAELEARQHLDRALELAPNDAGAVRLLAGRLLEARRFNEASQTLDRVAPRYPNDIEIQSQYATALVAQTGREEDAFVAYARVWKLSGRNIVDIDPLNYRTLMQGFDLRVYNLGKTAVQLTSGVANGALPREDALLQLTKLKEEMDLASNAITVLRAPVAVAPDGPASRAFAADLMSQALEAHQIYLETGQELQRVRGTQLNSQAVTRLNALRGGR